MRITDQTRALGKFAVRIVGTTSVYAIAIGGAYAQTAPAADAPQTVVVTGLRASLESALNKKREDNGIVDVIKAEDMGKFPDTNLAESLQRISGVSIDRSIGEGSKITVRGVGPVSYTHLTLPTKA